MRLLMFRISIGALVLAGSVFAAAVHEAEAQEMPDRRARCAPDAVPEVVAEDLMFQGMCGGALTAVEAAELELRLEAAPDDLKTRARLLGYLMLQPPGAGVRRNRTEHALWFIRNEPELRISGSPFVHIMGPETARAAARQVWAEHLERDPENLAILRNAAWFHSLPSADGNEAIELLERGRRLDPTNPHWSRQLGQLTEWDPRSGPEKEPERARQSLDHYERAWELSDLSGRDRLLEQLAWAALEAGELGKAREYAEAMLVEYPAEGNLTGHLQHGNMVLGHLALAEGDIEEAKVRLLAAVETGGTGRPGSFRPFMGLAKKLLERGESAVVLAYLERASELWTRRAPRIAEWTRAVEAGEMPDFGPYAIR